MHYFNTATEHETDTSAEKNNNIQKGDITNIHYFHNSSFNTSALHVNDVVKPDAIRCVTVGTVNYVRKLFLSALIMNTDFNVEKIIFFVKIALH